MPDPELSQIFKDSAKAVTQLYRKSIQLQDRAFHDGYEKCLCDIAKFCTEQQLQEISLYTLMNFLNEKHASSLQSRAIPREETPSTSQVSQQQPQILQPFLFEARVQSNPSFDEFEAQNFAILNDNKKRSPEGLKQFDGKKIPRYE
jgi:hypothetical protein